MYYYYSQRLPCIKPQKSRWARHEITFLTFRGILRRQKWSEYKFETRNIIPKMSGQIIFQVKLSSPLGKRGRIKKSRATINDYRTSSIFKVNIALWKNDFSLVTYWNFSNKKKGTFLFSKNDQNEVSNSSGNLISSARLSKKKGLQVKDVIFWVVVLEISKIPKLEKFSLKFVFFKAFSWVGARTGKTRRKMKYSSTNFYRAKKFFFE